MRYDAKRWLGGCGIFICVFFHYNLTQTVQLCWILEVIHAIFRADYRDGEKS